MRLVGAPGPEGSLGVGSLFSLSTWLNGHLMGGGGHGETSTQRLSRRGRPGRGGSRERAREAAADAFERSDQATRSFARPM
jgi:hypothetical protein